MTLRNVRPKVAILPPPSPARARMFKTYPALPLEKPPPPPPGPAINFHAARVALWRRVRRGARPLVATLTSGVAWAIIAPTVGLSNGFANVVLFLLSLAGAGALAYSIGSLRRTARYWRILRRHAWTVYTVKLLRVYRSPITMTLVDGDGRRFPIKIRGFANTAYFLGMVHREVWFVGNPEADGLLTVIGGGEIMRTRKTDGP
jgi:hypothetical protein